MFRNYRVFVIFAVVCALAAALFSVRIIQNYAGQVKVVAAARDLSPNSIVSANELAWRTIPKGALDRDTVVNPAQAEGYVAKGFIPAGTVLRQSMLEPSSAAGITGKLAQLSQGGATYYAVALPETLNTTVGAQVHTGDHVDVYLTTGTTPLASDVLVLDGVPVPTSNNQPANTPNTGLVLAVTSREYSALLPYLGSNNRGTLVLDLRPEKGAG